MKVLITIASEQVWPQIVPVYHLINKDKTIFDKIIIVHSHNTARSEEPAKRLETFIKEHKLSKEIYLQQVEEETDFSEPLNNLVSKLDITAADDDVYVNLTCGTKIMSIILSTWGTQKGYTLFYTYNGSKLQLYKRTSNNILDNVGTEDIDVSITNDIDPIEIVTLQCGEDYIDDVGNFYEDYNTMKKKMGSPKQYTDGIHLEEEIVNYFINSKIKYRHSVRLKSSKASVPHEEIDVLLNFNGSLWVIECKMKKIIQDWGNCIRSCLKEDYNNIQPENIKNLIKKIEKEIGTNLAMQYKADIFSAKKISGINAKVLWITTHKIPDHIKSFCDDEDIKYLEKISFDGYNNYLSKESKKELDKIFK